VFGFCLFGERLRLGAAGAEARARLVVERGGGFGPFPALGLEHVGVGLELLEHEAVEQLGIEQEDAVVALREEVAPERAARQLVVGQGNESRPPVGCRNLALREGCADVVGTASPAGQLAEHALLRPVVVGQGERLHLLEGELSGAVGVEDLRGHACEL